MRYITDINGYIKQLSFGADIVCDGEECTQYTGSVPTGYKTLEEWYIAESSKLYRWKIVSGNLTLDSEAAAPVVKKTLQTGHITAESVPAGGLRDIAVTFPVAFDKVPTVMLTFRSESESAQVGSFSAALTAAPTETGFNCRIFNNASGSRSPGLYWLATIPG